MRVSIISAIEESYAAYYRSNYTLADVKESIRYALSHGVYVSLNMLFFPGFNDRAEELEAWRGFFCELPVNMVQVLGSFWNGSRRSFRSSSSAVSATMSKIKNDSSKIHVLDIRINQCYSFIEILYRWIRCRKT